MAVGVGFALGPGAVLAIVLLFALLRRRA